MNLNNIKLLKEEDKLRYIQSRIESLVAAEDDPLANAANATALVMQVLDDLNWVGFYILKNNELVLGPFQGFPACTRIELGKGVCGTSASKKEAILVDDVYEFPGHIFCDDRSKSELVIPLIKDGEVLGVLDIDSPIKLRFEKLHLDFFTEYVDYLIEKIDFKKLAV